MYERTDECMNEQMNKLMDRRTDMQGNVYRCQQWKQVLVSNCHARPKPKPKLEAEMAIFSIITTTQPPIRTSLNLALDNSQKQSTYLSVLGL